MKFSILLHCSISLHLYQYHTVFTNLCLQIYYKSVVHMVKNLPAMQETTVQFWIWKIHRTRDRLLTPVFLVFPCGSDGKESTYNTGDPGSIPRSRRSPGEGNGNPLHYSCLENPRDGGAWWAVVYGVTQSRTWLKWLGSIPLSPLVTISLFSMSVLQISSFILF